MSFPDILHDLEERLYSAFREMLAHFLHPLESRFMATAQDILDKQNAVIAGQATLATAIDNLTARVSTNPSGILTQDQADQVASSLDTIATNFTAEAAKLDAILPAPVQ